MKKGIFITGRILKAIAKVSAARSYNPRYTGLYIIRDDLGTYAIATNGLAFVAYRLGEGGKAVGGRFEFSDIQILSANERYEVKLTGKAVFINSPNVSVMSSGDASAMADWRNVCKEKGASHSAGTIPAWEDVRKVSDVVAAIGKSEEVEGLVFLSARSKYGTNNSVSFVTRGAINRNGKRVLLDEELFMLVTTLNTGGKESVAPAWILSGDENNG